MNKILWLQTGGTIACKETKTGLKPGHNFISPEINCAYDTRVLFNLDSTNIMSYQWKIMAQTVFDACADYKGFVITHGTDTMQYSAAALSLMLPNFPKPIIFTGAMKPFHFANSDALTNLFAAFKAAQEKENGVFVAFNGKLIPGVSCIKVHTSDADAFADAQYKGEPYAVSKELRINLCEKVFTLKITPNISPEIADFILVQGYKGVICEAFGCGGIPALMLEKLGGLVGKGIRIVIVSQCLYGGANLSVYAAHRRALTLGLEAWNMTSSAALIRLMLELGTNPVNMD